jgi:dihydropteroate synthase
MAEEGKNSLVLEFLAHPFNVMGILNITPDSFSDGGRYTTTESAVKYGCQMEEEGAAVLDIGGQSTRPGAQEVSPEEEWGRIYRVLETLAGRVRIPISVDTTSSMVALRALAAGASIINDVSAGRFDSAMPAVIAEKKCPVILMHSRAKPATMQEMPGYGDVVAEVQQELQCSITMFIDAGVQKEAIILDPGIGFAKRFEDNCALLRNIDKIKGMGYPVCIGTSRKSFIGHITGEQPPERLYGSLASIVTSLFAGVVLFRVHDVKATVSFLSVLNTLFRI